MTLYPRLLHSAIPFTVFRDNYSPMTIWLNSKEAKNLPITDFESYAFWKSLLPEPFTIESITNDEPEMPESTDVKTFSKDFEV